MYMAQIYPVYLEMFDEVDFNASKVSFQRGEGGLTKIVNSFHFVHSPLGTIQKYIFVHISLLDKPFP